VRSLALQAPLSKLSPSTLLNIEQHLYPQNCLESTLRETLLCIVPLEASCQELFD
jgi:hypothetical protein